MRPFDPTQDPDEWRAELADWKKRQEAAREKQTRDRAALDRAERRVATLSSWVADLAEAGAVTTARAVQLESLSADLGAAGRSIAAVSEEILDLDEARAIATARVLGGPETAMPIVLAPLRVQTQWQASTLAVRWYPDVLSVDSHDPRLSPGERSAGTEYWRMRAGGAAPEARQAWENLVRRAGAARAAWIVRATDPSRLPSQGAPERASEWDTIVTARLLPDRFAVVVFAAGEAINVAAASQPPRYVSWGRAVAPQLPIEGLQEPDAATWMTDLDAALDAGMAVRISVPATAPRIEELLVVGLRGDALAVAGELGDLLEAHAFSDGLEIMADGAPTNNGEQIRAANSPVNDSDVARRLIEPARPDDVADGSAGAQLADALGVPRARLATVGGAGADRRTAPDAARLVVGIAAGGALRDLAGPGAQDAWSFVAPGGPAPVLRVGRQPYGVLPASAPLRWQAADGERTQALAALLQRWGRDRAAAVDLDPGDPPATIPAARRITHDDASTLHDLLLETPASIAWAREDGQAAFAGLAGLLGPADGDQSAASYLTALAGASDGELDAIATTLPTALLAGIALAARRGVANPDRAALAAGLRSLAALARDDGGRADLARLIGQHLDAVSHRIDAWLTAASAERLLAQRSAAPTDRLAVGAYGYLTDVEPRTQPRSHGHVHAPSLAHAATAAVLRAGYLGQRRAAWATQVARARDDLAAAPASAAARRALAEAEAGHAQLRPLDAHAESALPLAIDISSRRVRHARWVLAAVRNGQPLAAVLGYQFERDLADNGLQRYLAAFRKLTRFSTGTALEQLEDARRRTRDALGSAVEQLAALRAAAEATIAPVDAATTAHAAAQLAERAAAIAAAPYQAMQRELAELDANTIPRLTAALKAIDDDRPVPNVERRPITVP